MTNIRALLADYCEPADLIQPVVSDDGRTIRLPKMHSFMPYERWALLITEIDREMLQKHLQRTTWDYSSLSNEPLPPSIEKILRGLRTIRPGTARLGELFFRKARSKGVALERIEKVYHVDEGISFYIDSVNVDISLLDGEGAVSIHPWSGTLTRTYYHHDQFDEAIESLISFTSK